MAIVLAVVLGVPLIWLMLKAARWSAPISGTLGLLILWPSAVNGWDGGMRFGLGLFAFSAVFFIAGGGMRGR